MEHKITITKGEEETLFTATVETIPGLLVQDTDEERLHERTLKVIEAYEVNQKKKKELAEKKD